MERFEERNNSAVALGLDKLSLKEQTEFFVDYACLLESEFDDLFEKVGTTHQDLLSMANDIKNVADDVAKEADAVSELFNEFFVKATKINSDRGKRIIPERRFITVKPTERIDVNSELSVPKIEIRTEAEIRGKYKEHKEITDKFSIEQLLNNIYYENHDCDVDGAWREI